MLYLTFFVYPLNLLDLCVSCQGGLPIANGVGFFFHISLHLVVFH